MYRENVEFVIKGYKLLSKTTAELIEVLSPLADPQLNPTKKKNSTGKGPIWLWDELTFIQKNPDLSSEQIAHKLGRDESVVKDLLALYKEAQVNVSQDVLATVKRKTFKKKKVSSSEDISSLSSSSEDTHASKEGSSGSSSASEEEGAKDESASS